MMSRHYYKKITKLTVSLLAAVLVFAGCGGSGANNDQGASFMAFGYFEEGSGGEVGRTGVILPLFRDVDQFDGQFYTVEMGLRNMMTRQFVRVVRIDCSYTVEGSFINIPDDTFGFSTVLQPAPDLQGPQGQGQGQAGQTGPGFNSISFSGFEIISPDIFAFLNNNRNFLPELPFRMVATCSATGVTQSGNTLTTNPLNFFVQFVEEAECCTGVNGQPGFQQGPGTGGTVPFFEE